MGRYQLASKQQTPGGGVYEQRRAAPMCECQLPLLILSRISASRVALSGIRSSAWPDTSTPPLPVKKERTPATVLAPSGATGRGFLVAKFVSELMSGCAPARHLVQEGGLLEQHRYGVGFGTAIRAVMAARLTDCGRICSAKSVKGW